MQCFRSTKLFQGYPCTHRQWRADGHCRFVHGYSRSFFFAFACHTLSKEGWVVDFGGLAPIKKWLDHMFDHTFLVSSDDPELPLFRLLESKEVIQMRILPNVSMEGTAAYVYQELNPMIVSLTAGRAWISSLEVRENEKNSAIYTPDQSAS